MPCPTIKLALTLLATLCLGLSQARAAEYSFRRGVNISHWLSQNYEERTYAAGWFTKADVDWIAAQGFDHLRIPIDSANWTTPDGHLKLAALAPFDTACQWAQENGLGVILDMHSLPGADFSTGNTALFTDPATYVKAEALWSEIAAHYAEAGPWLRFELLNEPIAKENSQLNPIQAWLLQAIRLTNPTRVVYLTTNKSGSFAAVADLSLPDDPNIALTLHFYEPMLFSHQGAQWMYLNGLPPIEFPGTIPSFDGFLPGDSYWRQFSGTTISTEKSILPPFEMLSTLLKQKGVHVEIHIGEFGAYKYAPDDSRERYCEAIVRTAEQHGFGWAVWDYRGGFEIRNANGDPTGAMRGIAKAIQPTSPASSTTPASAERP